MSLSPQCCPRNEEKRKHLLRAQKVLPMEPQALSPLPQVLPHGAGQAPAHLLAAEDEGAAGEEAGQGLRETLGGGESAAPSGEGPAGIRLRWAGLVPLPKA